jgi:ferredoxin
LNKHAGFCNLRPSALAMNKTTPVIRDIVATRLVPADRYIYGFAGLEGLLNDRFSEYHCGISIGRKMDDGTLDGIVNGPTQAYLAHYDGINRELLAVAGQLANDLEQAGFPALAVTPTVLTGQRKIESYLPDLRYGISHKMVATRAGLGWIGKTDLFVSKKFGARLRLASILLKTPDLQANKPVEKSRCGHCRICVDRCPADAANGRSWDIRTDRDVFFNALKCWEQCGEFGRTVLHSDRLICGICVAVCPVKTQKPFH